jgi:hypothetical protein
MRKPQNNEDYIVKSIPKSHRLIFDMLDLSLKQHHVSVIAQVEIDLVLKLIEKYKEIKGEKISLTGYLIFVISQVIKKYEDVYAFRVGLKKYIFKDLDVHIIVERETQNGEKVPTSHIIRQANHKSILEIHNEIRKVQSEPIEGLVKKGSKRQKLQNLFSSFPRFIRKIIFKRMLKKPKLMKERLGNICVTAVGMLTKNIRTIGTPIPVQFWPLHFSLGCFDRKLIMEKGDIVQREILNVTITLDHDIIQGGTMTRFLSELYEMVKSAYGLNELLKK